MRVEFQPMVLVGAIAGFVLGQYTPVVVAKTSGGSGSGGETKQQMSCEKAIDVAQVATAIASVLLVVGENVKSSWFSGYAMGVIAASCPSS